MEMNKADIAGLVWTPQSNVFLLTDLQERTRQKFCPGQEERHSARTSVPALS